MEAELAAVNGTEHALTLSDDDDVAKALAELEALAAVLDDNDGQNIEEVIEDEVADLFGDTDLPAEVAVKSAPAPRPAPKKATVAANEPAPTSADLDEVLGDYEIIDDMDTPKSSKSRVKVRGEADVVLIGNGQRISVPAKLAPGSYSIEATFPGEGPVELGKVDVKAGSDTTIQCNARMGICRAS